MTTPRIPTTLRRSFPRYVHLVIQPSAGDHPPSITHLISQSRQAVRIVRGGGISALIAISHRQISSSFHASRAINMTRQRLTDRIQESKDMYMTAINAIGVIHAGREAVDCEAQ
jgi:copper homeostasis protein CutC